MPVKRSQSALRVMAVIEAIAGEQPVGVSALARRLGLDKSATQRALMTLVDAGWIRTAPGSAVQWELTPRILAMAKPPYSIQDLRRRARDVLEALRRDTGETVFLTVPDLDRFVIVEALESAHKMRMIPPIGMIVPARESATGRIVLAFCGAERQAEYLGGPPDAQLLAEYSAARRRGYSYSDGEIDPSSVSFAAPIFGSDPEPIGAVVLSGPRERIAPGDNARIGGLLADAAAILSRRAPLGAQA